MIHAHHWWQLGIIYQLYPRSFMDSNDDGIGDLPGVIEKLDYLKWLGIDALWLSPIHPSPMKDFGYDISDYLDVDPLFGTLADFDALVVKAHKRGLRVILDFVPNHTSDQHPWFVESRSSRHNLKRGWYIWRDPAPDGGPPNNWLSHFGGSAWTWDAATGQYYYHAYLEEQPDLNWRNPEVKTAMFEVLRFWLDRGVDGFRVDAIKQLIEDEQLRSNPPNPDYRPGQSPYRQWLPLYTTDQPEVHDVLIQMRRVLDEYAERMMVAEIYDLPLDRLMAYYGAEGKEAHMPFNFELIRLPWDARVIAAGIAAYEATLPLYGWPNWVLGNHDQPRIASRVGPAQARVAAMLLLTLRGTPTLYYGDEVSMQDVEIPPGLVQDPWEKNVPGLRLGRDPARTPMQWDKSLNAGFTRGRPWLPVARDFPFVNVAVERLDPTSILTLYRRLIRLRRSEPALLVGSYTALEAGEEVIGYIRRIKGQGFMVLLNLSSQPKEVKLDTPAQGPMELSTYLDRGGECVNSTIRLRDDEGVIVRLGFDYAPSS